MGKAIASTSDEMPKDQAGIREERISGGWDRFEADEKRVSLFYKLNIEETFVIYLLCGFY